QRGEPTGSYWTVRYRSTTGRLQFGELSTAPVLHCRARLAVYLSLPDGLALVVRLLAAGQADGELDLPALEIQAERNQGHSLLDGVPDEFPGLLAVQQQLAAPRRLMLGVAAVCILRDVDVVDEDLAALDARVAVAQVDAALADRLHLRALQDDAG